MSKSKGNIVEPFSTMKENGADVVRWYIPYASPVWTPLKFDIRGFSEVHSKFFSTLKNTYSFFSLYANTDNIDPREYNVAYEDLAEIDKWLLSKYNSLVKYVTESYNVYDLTKVVRSITEFVSEDLSNWYIRRNRRRFWSSELTTDKKAVYQTTYQVLEGIAKMAAPIAPFTAEEVFTKLTGEESVHLSSFPKYDETAVNETLEKRMDLVRSLITLGRNVREEAKVKVRQPLSEALIDGTNESLIGDMVNLISEELNVKSIVYTTDLGKYMNFQVKPNFKVAGPVFGPKIKDFANSLANLGNEEVTKLQNNESIELDGMEITPDMTDIRISEKEGFNVAMENNNFIILNTSLNDELIEEGIARELISKIQNMRKESGFEITDRIIVSYKGDELVTKTINNCNKLIKDETLAIDMKETELNNEAIDINGHETYLNVEKSN